MPIAVIIINGGVATAGDRHRPVNAIETRPHGETANGAKMACATVGRADVNQQRRAIAVINQMRPVQLHENKRERCGGMCKM